MRLHFSFPRQFISKLPDKGAKIQEFHDKIVRELESKDLVEKTCQDLLKLEISKKYVLEDIEWGKKGQDYEYIDSDDDDNKDNNDNGDKTLKILARNGPCKKQIKKIVPEKPLITVKDLQDITGENNLSKENHLSLPKESPLSLLPHVKYLLKKDENSHKEPKPKFLPYKSTKSDVHNPFKELTRCQKLKKFEITAATPPPSINGPVKCLTLLESLALQKEQEEHRKVRVIRESVCIF